MARSFGCLLLLIALVTLVNGMSRVRRLAGGKDVIDGQFPYMDSIKYKNKFVCGGTIISPTKILTAANCVSVCQRNEQKDYSDFVGHITVTTGSVDLSKGGNTNNAKRIIIPDNYIPLTFANDLAIITLEEKITESEHEKAIDLPDKDTVENTNAITTGWGAMAEDDWASNILKSLKESIISSEKCNKFFNGVKVDVNDFCAVAALGTNQSGLCNGDSGNPLVQDGKLIGISTWGQGCAEGYPDVFANIYRHLEFIKTELK